MAEDTDKDQEWARAGGKVYLEVDDSDLDVPVKYVILPDELEPRGRVSATMGSVTVRLATSTAALAKGDTVLVEGNTIREVTAVDGRDITLNRTLSEVGGSLSISEVTYADANVKDCETCAAAQEEEVMPLGYIELDNAPVADSGVSVLGNRIKGATDSRTSSKDVYLADTNSDPANIPIQQINNDEERVEVSPGAQGDTVYVVYWGSSENDTGSTVKVRSSADSDGIIVVLAETGKSTGLFRGYIMLTDETDSVQADRTLRVNPSGTVTLRYDDDGTTRTKAIEVETTRPVLSNFSPAHNFAGRDERPEVMADVTDSDSGVDDSDVYVVFARLDGDMKVMGGTKVARSMNVDQDGRSRSITDGVRAEQRLTDRLRDDDATIAWWVVAEDMAGNVAVSDQNTESDSTCNSDDFPGLGGILVADYTKRDPPQVDDLTGRDVSDEDFMSDCQPFIVKVDNIDPQLESSITGSFWDTGKDGDDKTNDDATAAKPTSIRLNFSEALDGASVSASDFEVDGRDPLDANHYSAAADHVFLTVSALNPHDTPKIELVGEVADPAGNSVNSGTTGDDDGGASDDGIAPTLTVTLEGVTSGDRPVTDKEITITVTTDENTSNPSVMITMVGMVTADGKGLLDGTTTKLTPKVKSPRTYETSWSTTNEGLYNVYVTATDGDNTGKSGTSGMKEVDHDDNSDTADVMAYAPIDLSSDTSALLFEVDNEGPEFSLKPDTSDDPNAFIQVDFADEGSENTVMVKDPGADGHWGTGDDGKYLDSDGKATSDMDDAKMVDLDSYAMVTILSATLDGDDISDALERLGDGSFLLAAPDLAVGEYKIKIKAEDSAGNDKESEMTLKITERKPFSLNIRAGVSLISFPGNPTDPDINAVFPMDHPVQEIATYDPTMPGKWFASQRDENTGMLDGNLLTISGNQAYLVRSTSSESLSVVIDRPSAHDLITPPQIDLVKGWNLVPVLDVTFGLAQGGKIGYETYFGKENADISRVYGVDTIRNRLTPVESNEDLEVGKGYWVFASKATSVAPGRAADDE